MRFALTGILSLAATGWLGALTAGAQVADVTAPGAIAEQAWDSSQRISAEQKALKAGKRFGVRKAWNLCKEERDLDCASQGILVASDGNCYFASSTHSNRHGAVVFRYDPITDEITRLCDDISDVCGEDPRAQGPQGIMPTNAVEVDGWIYWGTHTGQSGFTPRQQFLGGHIVGYNLKSATADKLGEWRDFGIPAVGRTIFAGLTGDAKGKRLYMTISPMADSDGEATHLYRLDLPTGKFQDAGVICYGGMIGFPGIWADITGRCWVGAPGGVLLCYDPAAGVMRGWLDALPPGRTDQGFPDPNSAEQVARAWDWVRPIPDTNQCLFTLKQSAGFNYFLPGMVGRGRGSAFGELRPLTGFVGQACAIADERLYFIQPVELSYAPGVALLHLRSVDYTDVKASVIDHGAIVDERGRLPLRIDSLAVDIRRRVYMVGDWRTLPGDATTLLALGGGYSAINRAEFFATGEVPVK